MQAFPLLTQENDWEDESDQEKLSEIVIDFTIEDSEDVLEESFDLKILSNSKLSEEDLLLDDCSSFGSDLVIDGLDDDVFAVESVKPNYLPNDEETNHSVDASNNSAKISDDDFLNTSSDGCYFEIPIEELASVDKSIGVDVITSLKANHIHNVKDFLLCKKSFIISGAKISISLYETMVEVAQKMDPSYSLQGCTTAALYHINRSENLYKIKTGSTKLDDMLGGGVQSSTLTEIFGESKSGKTQICHTLSVVAQLPLYEGDSGGKVIYIDTNGSFRPERLTPISERFELNPKYVLENIQYLREYTSDQQIEHIRNVMNEISNARFNSRPYRLMIIDSGTALFRTEYKRTEINARQIRLGKYLELLTKLAEQFNIPVVVTNQVMASIENTRFSGSSPSKPIGGHTLAHSMTTRVELRYFPSSSRTASIYKSASRPEVICDFGIYADGIDNVRGA